METTAYHESGHALMAWRLGARVMRVTIEPDWDDGPRRSGDTQIEWPRAKLTRLEYYQAAILVSLAGPVAEIIYTGDPLHPAHVAEWASDWDEAAGLAAELVPGEAKQMAYLEQTTRELIERMRDTTVWAALAALADELLAHETLDGEDVEAVMDVWLG